MSDNTLQSLYDEISKHGQYQALPEFMRNDLALESDRYKHFKLCDQRLNFMYDCGVLDGMSSMVEVGANIGFFALSIAKKLPEMAVHTIEANNTFCEISRQIAGQYGLNNVKVSDAFFPFLDAGAQPAADLGVIYNVVHHGGAEYDQEECETKEDWFAYMSRVMAALSGNYKRMVIQIGYNWGGNREQPLHSVTDPTGFTLKLADIFHQSGWSVSTLGVPVQAGDSYDYDALDLSGMTENETSSAIEENVQLEACKDFTLSEFFRRPIFVLEKAA